MPSAAWPLTPIAQDCGCFREITIDDNTLSIIASGLRTYGFDEDACTIMDGIVKAAQHFDHDRLPEDFAGFSRTEFQFPVRYPVTCHPEAWAAGAVAFTIESLMGMVPKGWTTDSRYYVRCCRILWIRMLCDDRQDPRSAHLKRRNASSTRLWRGTFGFTPSLQPIDRRTHAHF